MNAQEKERPLHDVVIVGAGISGLCAANKLKEKDKNLNVLVLEARDRVGGRTHTIQSVNGVYVDLGGQWTGPGQPDINRLAKELNVKTYAQHHEGKKIVDLDGEVSHYSGEIPTCLGLFALIDLQLMIWRINRMTKKVPTSLDESLYNCPYVDEWDSLSCETFLKRHAWTRATVLLVEAVVRGILGVEPSELSLLNLLLYCNSNGGVETIISIPKGHQQRIFVKGAQQISIRLAKKFEALCTEQSVLLNTAVAAIEKKQDVIEVHCTNGAVYRTKHIILAIPPVIANKISFTPRLPPGREKLMQKNYIGSIIKTVIFYKEAFWRKKGLSGEVVCDCAEGIVHNVFDKSAPLKGSSKNSEKKKGEEEELKEQPGLVCFINGSNAVYASEYMSPEARKKEVLLQLEKWFGTEARDPIEYLEKDWVSDDWSRGCPVGIFPAGALWQVGHLLRQPCYDGTLHWAGTETATRQMGYMDGACQSGERAAEEVWEAIQSDSNEEFREKKRRMAKVDKILGNSPNGRGLIDSRRNPRPPANHFWLFVWYAFLFVAFLATSFYYFLQY